MVSMAKKEEIRRIVSASWRREAVYYSYGTFAIFAIMNQLAAFGGDERTLSQGHSGFEVSVDMRGQVRKRSRGESAERLRRQCEKQRMFVSPHRRFRVAEILESYADGDDFVFVMPWYRSDSATSFVDRVAPNGLFAFFSEVLEFLSSLLSASEIGTVPTATVLRKSEETARAVLLQHREAVPELATWIARHIESIQRCGAGFRLPLGACHGDLTFSNILFCRDRSGYVLVDFLDVYFETPLHDVIKVRQELSLGWSSVLAAGAGLPHDRPKYLLATRTLGELLDRFVAQYDWAADALPIFEFQNLLRVLRYASKPQVVSVITDRMRMLHGET